MTSKAIILIQAIQEPGQFAFDYPLEQVLKKSGLQVITIDSLSDRSITQLILKAMDENEMTFLVFDTRLSKHIGIGQSILNASIKNKKVELICLGDPGDLMPFIKLFKGKSFSSEEEVTNYISSN